MRSSHSNPDSPSTLNFQGVTVSLILTERGAQVSTEAHSCPHCGVPSPTSPSTALRQGSDPERSTFSRRPSPPQRQRPEPQAAAERHAVSAPTGRARKYCQHCGSDIDAQSRSLPTLWCSREVLGSRAARYRCRSLPHLGRTGPDLQWRGSQGHSLHGVLRRALPDGVRLHRLFSAPGVLGLQHLSCVLDCGEELEYAIVAEQDLRDGVAKLCRAPSEEPAATLDRSRAPAGRHYALIVGTPYRVCTSLGRPPTVAVRTRPIVY